MANWIFVMHGGIEPGEAFGPYETAEEQEALVLKKLRENDELLCEHGDTTIHWLEAGDGKPELGSFSGGFMAELRAKVTAEKEHVAEA